MMRAVHPWSKKGQGFAKLSPNDICGGAIAHPVRPELVEGLSFFVQRAAPSAARPNPKTWDNRGAIRPPLKFRRTSWRGGCSPIRWRNGLTIDTGPKHRMESNH
ncbi:hypothetical protein, partial [Sphingomonas sp.]|uniref:hypothetical protein n=1 Tax=Sphingomonas sp. TaxID=28214 RepID=UPI00257C9A89